MVPKLEIDRLPKYLNRSLLKLCSAAHTYADLGPLTARGLYPLLPLAKTCPVGS